MRKNLLDLKQVNERYKLSVLVSHLLPKKPFDRVLPGDGGWMEWFLRVLFLMEQ